MATEIEQNDSISGDSLMPSESDAHDVNSTPVKTNAPQLNVWDSLETIKKDLFNRFNRNINSKSENLRKQFETDIEGTKEKLEAKIDDSKLKIIETLGIFVALFTFVSIEFQIFRSFTSWQAGASLTLIILGALLFFCIIVISLLDKEFSQSTRWLFVGFSLLILLGGIFLFGWSKLVDSDFISKQEIGKDFYMKSQVDSQWSDFKSCIWNRGLSNCLK